MRRPTILLALITLGLPLAACGKEAEKPDVVQVPFVEDSRAIGGHEVQIRVLPGTRPPSDAWDTVEEVLDQVERILRTLDPDDPQGALARLAAGAGGAEPVPVGREVYDVLSLALDLARRTQGAYDPTEGGGEGGWRHVELHPPTRAVRLAREGMRIELRGVAEGYAAQTAWATLGMADHPACCVTIGPVVVTGDPLLEGTRWPVAGPEGATLGIVRNACALAADGAAVVIAPDAPSAAAYAAALRALPPEEGLAAAEGTAGVEGSLRLEDGTWRSTSGYEEATRTKPLADK